MSLSVLVPEGTVHPSVAIGVGTVPAGYDNDEGHTMAALVLVPMKRRVRFVAHID